MKWDCCTPPRWKNSVDQCVCGSLATMPGMEQQQTSKKRSARRWGRKMDTWRGVRGNIQAFSSGWHLLLQLSPPEPTSPRGSLCVGALCTRLSQRPAGWMTSTLGDLHQSSTNASWEGRQKLCSSVTPQSIAPAPLREMVKLFQGWWKAQILQEHSAGVLIADLRNRSWLTPEPYNFWRFLVIFTQEEFISFNKMLRGFLSRIVAFRLLSDPGERCNRLDSPMHVERRAPLRYRGLT